MLLAPVVLRAWGVGQCDLVRFCPQRRHVVILEVKGAGCLLTLSQQRRLAGAAQFVAKLLGASVRIEVAGRS